MWSSFWSLRPPQDVSGLAGPPTSTTGTCAAPARHDGVETTLAQQVVGFAVLAYEPGCAEQYWVYHFFVDRTQQGKGYGRAALGALLRLVAAEHSRCRQINLTVHPENVRAQRLYTGFGFRATGAVMDGEPVYALPIGAQL